jgi:hypothetical protein
MIKNPKERVLINNQQSTIINHRLRTPRDPRQPLTPRRQSRNNNRAWHPQH